MGNAQDYVGPGKNLPTCLVSHVFGEARAGA
jgi:hypothetical protein